MHESLGAYRPYPQLDHEIVLTYWPSRYTLQWSQCGRIPDFVATYLVSTEESAIPRASSNVRTAVSYLLNELVENCVKFYLSGTIRIRVGIHESRGDTRAEGDGEDAVIFEVTNQISKEEKPVLFQKFAELLQSDPEELFVARMEGATEEQTERGASNLGLLSMMLDYEAQLGWGFTPVDDDDSRFWMQTMVRVPYRAVAGDSTQDSDQRTP